MESPILEDITPVRLFKKQSDEIDCILNKTGDKYESKAHFIRCAIQRLIRQEKNVIIFDKMIGGGNK